MIADAGDDTFIDLPFIGGLAVFIPGMKVHERDAFFISLMHFFDDLHSTDRHSRVHGLGGHHTSRGEIDNKVVHSCLSVSVCKNSVFTQHIRIFNIFTDETWKKKR